MSSQKIYCLSGIGADQRIFQFIDIPGVELVHITWLSPAKGEDLEQYAKRLSAAIREEKFMLAGVSFGGMIATEIAKLHPEAKVIIFSSAKTTQEIPFYLKVFKWLPLYKILPNSLMHRANAFFYFLFGAKTRPVKATMKAIMKDTDASFIRWAMGAVLHWKNAVKPTNVYHAHGNRDLILPHYFAQADAIISEGTHLMILEKPERINQYLMRLVQNEL